VLRVRTGDLPLRVVRRFMEEDLWKKEELIAMVMVFSKRKRNTCM
tara:strand:+ start:790 stop:924 length:135 start_codon:yes stop_codon:yes gene_type:complete